MKKCVVEVFSRVTGFFRPVQDWNSGKKEEFKDRNKFKIETLTRRKNGTVNKHSSADCSCSSMAGE